MQVAYIELEVAGGQRRRLPGGKLPISIGRQPDNTVFLKHSTVSRYHCVIELSRKGLTIRDMNSRNGVKLNGLVVKNTEFKSGDTLTVGEIPIVVRYEIAKGAKARAAEPREPTGTITMGGDVSDDDFVGLRAATQARREADGSAPKGSAAKMAEPLDADGPLPMIDFDNPDETMPG